MGKRSEFKRVEKDFYPTPYEAVVPLLAHLPPLVEYDEPCAGLGDLVKHLDFAGAVCRRASDIEESRPCVWVDALDLQECVGDMFITNPPYTWSILNPLIYHLSDIAPTWLLLPADMMHNKRMGVHMKKCVKVVSVGRVKWFGNMTGMENSAWYLFIATNTRTQFFGREQ